MRYILETFDGETAIFPCWRKARAAMRKALPFTYSAWIKPYRGRK